MCRAADRQAEPGVRKPNGGGIVKLKSIFANIVLGSLFLAGLPSPAYRAYVEYVKNKSNTLTVWITESDTSENPRYHMPYFGWFSLDSNNPLVLKPNEEKNMRGFVVPSWDTNHHLYIEVGKINQYGNKVLKSKFEICDRATFVFLQRFDLQNNKKLTTVDYWRSDRDADCLDIGIYENGIVNLDGHWERFNYPRRDFGS